MVLCGIANVSVATVLVKWLEYCVVTLSRCRGLEVDGAVTLYLYEIWGLHSCEYCDFVLGFCETV